jgi:hypothetical protein
MLWKTNSLGVVEIKALAFILRRITTAILNKLPQEQRLSLIQELPFNLFIIIKREKMRA